MHLSTADIIHMSMYTLTFSITWSWSESSEKRNTRLFTPPCLAWFEEFVHTNSSVSTRVISTRVQASHSSICGHKSFSICIYQNH